ncbi:MAG: DUF933 domain-containing protein [Candidatus Omnitrophica bacterium]|nr:DUF933 domain-containing protein [Candidatus Omnitrophota bacterium]MBD3268980.1 DUF933 domain-containing protein [Candidatus Omnitrophota bacterium]
MKVYNLGLDLEAGKYKYETECFKKLLDKFSPAKKTPYTVEFTNQEPEKTEAVVFNPEKKLDLVLNDLDRVEKRILRAESREEQEALESARKKLEEEKFLCDCDFEEDRIIFLKQLQLLTFKPAVEIEDAGLPEKIIETLLFKAGVILFYTVGKKEVKIWSLKRGLTILDAAGKIHSDLRRGFIRGEVFKCKNLDSFFNLAEARMRGFVKSVDKSYTVEEGDVIEIKFSV